MSQSSDLGKRGEVIAADHLRKKGYTIIKQNFTWGRAEVDIIASQGNKMIFVEVKARESYYLSDPALMVPIQKQKQIIKAADAFMKKCNSELNVRFDIVTVITNQQFTKIVHIEDAFYPTI